MTGFAPEQLTQLRVELASRTISSTDEHLTTDEMLEYAIDRCTPEEVEGMDRHLDGCEVCAEDMGDILNVVAPWGPRIAAARGTSGQPTAITSGELLGLAGYLRSENHLERVAALAVAEALGSMAARAELTDELAHMLGDSADDDVRIIAAQALEATLAPEILFADREVFAAMIKGIGDKSSPIYTFARRALGSASPGMLRGVYRDTILALKGLAATAADLLGPVPAFAEELMDGKSVWRGTLQDGKIRCVMQRDMATGDIDLRFGTHEVEEFRDALIVVSMDGDAIQAAEMWLALVPLEPSGRDQLGGRVHIPHADLAAGAELQAKILRAL